MVDLELKCLVPRKRVNVMLIGNHSAGKSSFVNWCACRKPATHCSLISPSPP